VIGSSKSDRDLEEVRHIKDQDDRDHQKDEMNLEAQAVLRGPPALEDEDNARHRYRMYGDVHKADRASDQ
jgi:hypothetical protein